MSDKPKIRVTFPNDRNSAKEVSETLLALQDLSSAIAELTTGDRENGKLGVTFMGFICDGCEKARPGDHDDWLSVDGLDYCPDCRLSSAPGEAPQ